MRDRPPAHKAPAAQITGWVKNSTSRPGDAPACSPTKRSSSQTLCRLAIRVLEGLGNRFLMDPEPGSRDGRRPGLAWPGLVSGRQAFARRVTVRAKARPVFSMRLRFGLLGYGLLIGGCGSAIAGDRHVAGSASRDEKPQVLSVAYGRARPLGATGAGYALKIRAYDVSGRRHPFTGSSSRMRSRAPLGPCDRNWCNPTA